MAYFYAGSNNVVAGTAVTMASLDFLYVAENVTIGSSTNNDGVSATTSAHVNVAGSIISVGGSAFFGSGGGHRMVVGETGTISGGLLGIDINGTGTRLANAGTIMGEGAIDLSDGFNQIVNSGHIIASFLPGIKIGGGGSSVSNSGDILSADDVAIEFTGLFADDVNVVENSGVIASGHGLVTIGGGNNETDVFNSGKISGIIFFNGADDKYDGAEGKLADGYVFGNGGDDTLIGGAARDQFQGGQGADLLEGGGAHDTFVYDGATESNGDVHDRITDFDGRKDNFDLNVAVTGIDADVNTGQLRAGHFGSDVQNALPASALLAHHAVLFTASSGDLNGHTILVVDANGTAGFQKAADYAFDITDATTLGHLGLENFI